jgi:hypothetical protein
MGRKRRVTEKRIYKDKKGKYYKHKGKKIYIKKSSDAPKVHILLNKQK